jgi:hypothetical protein
MIETHIVLRNRQLVQVASTQRHHIQQNELRIEGKDQDDLADYRL